MMMPKEAFWSAFRTTELFRSGVRFVDRLLELIDRDRFAVEFQAVFRIHAHDRVLEFGRSRARGLRFRQVDVHFRLILFESGRDDEKDQQDRQDIDQRDDDDRRRAAFADGELHRP